MVDVIIYRGAVLLHRVRHLMVFVATPFGGEEAVLTHIKVETLEAAVAETTDGRRLKLELTLCKIKRIFKFWTLLLVYGFLNSESIVSDLIYF